MESFHDGKEEVMGIGLPASGVGFNPFVVATFDSLLAFFMMTIIPVGHHPLSNTIT